MLRIFIHCFLLLGISNISSAQEVLFMEDFNDCALTDQWSFQLTGNQNVSWGVGLPMNSKAEGSSIDGTCMLYVDDDLTGDKTPAFNLRIYSDFFNGEGYSDISFNAQVHFRRDKTEFLRIIIDNGEKEHVIREFKGSNFSGTKFSDFINMKSDLSFIATDSMRIIIEYDDDNQWGWWAGIDNIKITGTKGGAIVFGETFNDCLLPDGWSTEILSGVDNWKFGLFTDGKSIDGTCFTYFNDDVLGENAPLSKIRLYSPEFNATQFAEYQLTYDFIFRFYEKNEYLQLYVDNGKEWIPIKTYNGDYGGPNVNQSKKDTIDLSPFRSEKIRLIWEYNDGGWAWWLGFDNVKVTGQGNINDRCSKSLSLSLTEACQSFDNTNALKDDEFEAASSGNTGILYYSFEAPESADYEIKSTSIFNDKLEIFSGTCDNPVLIQGKDKDEYGFRGEQLNFNAIAGETYMIRIYGYQAEFGLDKGSGCIDVSKKSDMILPPSGDVCDAAIPVVANADCIVSKNIKANLDGPLPKTNQRSRADVWFSFTPQTDGDYEFTSNADFADVLAVYKGNCSDLLELNSDFNGYKIDIKNAEAEHTYFIQVTGYFAILEGDLCPTVKTKVINEVPETNCISAFPLTLNNDCSVSSNFGAGYSGIRPDCDVYIQDDVWFSFVASASRQVYIKVKTDFENIVSLYEGSCDSLKSIYCGKNVHHCNGYLNITNLEPGKTYFIQLGSKVLHGRHIAGDICINLLDTEPAWQKINLQVAQVCISKGAVKFIPTAMGGSGTYTYNGLGLEEAVAGGNSYIVEAKDADGCVNVMLVDAVSCNDFGCTLTSQISKINPECHGASDGQASVAVVGGLEPYNITWSDGSSGAEITNLSSGTYTVTITDGSGCEQIENFSLNQPAQIVANPGYKSPLCNNDSTGVIMLFTIGGQGDYSYLWSEGSTGNKLENIPGGDYSVTITDGYGCKSSQSFILNQPDKISISGATIDNPCFGNNQGKISVEIKGGITPYSILWSQGDTLPNVDSLAAGTYSISVFDANNCTSNKTWEIIQPLPFLLQEDSIDLIFSSLKNAAIDISMAGGTAPYKYEWYLDDTRLDIDTEDIFPDAGGNYHVDIKDVNGCTYTSKIWTVSRSTNTIDNQTFGLLIQPNPTRDFIHLILPEKIIIDKLELKDIFGRTCKSISVDGMDRNIKSIDLSDLLSGTYFLTWHISGVAYTSKVVKVN
ncbi:MAG: hypothetical protein IPL63_10580 [Saprospiraceae bacterium]|nr:hypothetical protein [Saprospiraceae bacterium]